ILPFFFPAEDGIRDLTVTGVQTCALPILSRVRDQRHARQPVRPRTVVGERSFDRPQDHFGVLRDEVVLRCRIARGADDLYVAWHPASLPRPHDEGYACGSAEVSAAVSAGAVSPDGCPFCF